LPSIHEEPYQRLFHKLKITARCLSKWSRSLFSNTKVLLHAALLVILHLDLALEGRTLSPEERDLRACLKRRVVSLAVVERARKKQCARISNIKEGDSNTKFFHLRVNARRRKNHIQRIKHNGGWVTNHSQKEKIIHDHFATVMGRGPPREYDFNWESIAFSEVPMTGIEDPFSEEEVHNAISQMPADKVPSPDGFTGAFFKKCWPTMKEDVLCAINSFNNLHVTNLQWLNSANIVLLPKKVGAEEISEYRPISLIHAIAKIITKMIALCLAPLMNDLVSNGQSAFIKKKIIHDNFMYVRNLARRLHKSKIPSLLFKLDIRKAFDSVSWEFILELVRRHAPPPNLVIELPPFYRLLLPGLSLMGWPASRSSTGGGLGKGTPYRRSFLFSPLTPSNKFLSWLPNLSSLAKFGDGALSLELPYMRMMRPFLLLPKERRSSAYNLSYIFLGR
jgi:hypothetical protein